MFYQSLLSLSAVGDGGGLGLGVSLSESKATVHRTHMGSSSWLLAASTGARLRASLDGWVICRPLCIQRAC